MNGELTSNDPWDCCFCFLLVLCVTRYALCVAVVRDAWCVVVRFHALLCPLNCGPRATYLVEFSMLLAVHITQYLDYYNTHLRCDNPAKCSRTLVAFFVVALSLIHI